MIKVTNITEEGRWGGPQVRITKVAKRLLRDVETLVIIPDVNSGEMRRQLEEAGVSYVTVKMHRLSNKIPLLLKYMAGFIPEVFRLKKLLKKYPIDLVHVNGCWQIKGVIAAKIVGVKVIWHLNDTHVPGLLRKLFYLFAPLAHGFILASERTKNYYLGETLLAQKPLMVIQAPVDVKEFDPDQVKPDADMAAYDGLKVVTVASINPIKGLERFIKMAKKVTEEINRDVHFFIVGPIYDSQKKYGDKLRSMVKDTGCTNIHFYGRSMNIPGILKAADLYICCSHFEASPIAVWEAMAMGVPVVSTDVGDVKQFVGKPDAVAGAIVESDNTCGLAKEVVHYLKNGALRREAGINARAIAQSELDIEICVNRHAHFYTQVLSQY